MHIEIVSLQFRILGPDLADQTDFFVDSQGFGPVPARRLRPMPHSSCCAVAAMNRFFAAL
jgi:hypothetical protein